MKFLGKWIDLEDIILSEVTQSQKDIHAMHSLMSGKLRIPKMPFAQHTKLKKKEDQSVDTLLLLRMVKKYPWKELQRQSSELRQ